MAAGWYCKINGDLKGPMPLTQLMELARSGNLQPADAVRRKTGEWVTADQIRGLFDASSPIIPTPAATVGPLTSVTSASDIREADQMGVDTSPAVTGTLAGDQTGQNASPGTPAGSPRSENTAIQGSGGQDVVVEKETSTSEASVAPSPAKSPTGESPYDPAA